MNIHIPQRYKDLELKETEAIIVAFMTMVATEHGFEHSYNISAYDFKKIIGNTVVPTDDRMPKLKQVLSIIAINEHNWILKFKDYARDKNWYTTSGRGKIKLYQYRLTDTRNIGIWCYLMGVYHSTKDLIGDSHKLFEHESGTHTMEMIEVANFRIENRDPLKGKRKIINE